MQIKILVLKEMAGAHKIGRLSIKRRINCNGSIATRLPRWLYNSGQCFPSYNSGHSITGFRTPAIKRGLSWLGTEALKPEFFCSSPNQNCQAKTQVTNRWHRCFAPTEHHKHLPVRQPSQLYLYQEIKLKTQSFQCNCFFIKQYTNLNDSSLYCVLICIVFYEKGKSELFRRMN